MRKSNEKEECSKIASPVVSDYKSEQEKVEELAEVIAICLIVRKFYENKRIDIENYPNYKLNDKMNPFGVSVVENVPQQSSSGLDCGLYMITYVKFLTFGEGFPSVDFDPDLIRIR
ncbi:hypothetical protein T459_30252 [Capsicum annuum]|uniref:Ubiquitin-like protease family profile domain-containing protein n=1 Tax=Capsicum annuum TaxID=4072 RepID=A0A2G2Y7V0_CAPAN|nr:hypothetical protein T459_30252 [Capsicum annuum]